MANKWIYYLVGMTLGFISIVSLAFFNMSQTMDKEVTLEMLILPGLVGLFIGFLLSNSVLYFLTVKELKAKDLILQQYKDAVDSCLIVSKSDLKGRITYVNKQFEDISGFSADSLLGRHHNIIRHPDVPKETYKRLWETIQSKSIWKGVLKNRSRSGESYTVSATVIPLLDVKGNITEYLSLRTDVTKLENYRLMIERELERKSKNLNESEHQFSQHQKAMSIASTFTRMDLDGFYTYANQNFLDLLGYKYTDIVGEHCHNFASSVDAKIFFEIREKIKNDSTWKGVVSIEAKNGVLKNLVIEFVPIFDDQGNIVEMFNFYHYLSDYDALHKKV